MQIGWKFFQTSFNLEPPNVSVGFSDRMTKWKVQQELTTTGKSKWKNKIGKWSFYLQKFFWFKNTKTLEI